MSLFDTLLGNASHADTHTNQSQQQSQLEDKTTNTVSNQQTNNVQTSNQQSATNSNTTQQNQSSASGRNVTSTLDANTMGTLQQLIRNLSTTPAGGGSQGAINNVVQTILQNAQKPAVSDADIAGKQSAAVTSFNQGEAVDIGRLQNAIGSKNNTYSTLVAQKGQQDLASTLAGIVADAHLQNTTVQNQQLQTAIQALVQSAGVGSQNVQDIAGLVAQLKGATTTEDTSQSISGQTNQQNVANTVAQLLDILNGNTTQNVNQEEQTGTQTNINQSSSTGGSQGSGFLGLFS